MMTSLILSSLLSAALGQAATSTTVLVLSRADVVERVANQNPQVVSARAEVYRRQAQARQVRAARFPTLSVFLAAATGEKANLVDGTAVASERSAYDFKMSDLTVTLAAQGTIVQPLYTFGKIDDRAEAAAHAGRAAQAQVRMTRESVAFEAAKLYEAHLYAKAMLLFVEDLESIAQSSLEDTEDMLADGSPDVSQNDLLRVKAALSFAKVQHQHAAAGVRQSEAGLRAYLGLRPEQPFKLADEHMTPLSTEPGSLEQLVQLAHDKRPEFEALREAVMAFDKLASAERAAFYPNIALAGYLSAAYTPGRDWITSRYVFDRMGHVLPVAAVVAQWELNWDMPEARAKEVEADRIKYAGQLEWAKQGIPALVTKAYEDVRRARGDLAELKQGVPDTRQWMVRASADYEMGLGGSREITDAAQFYVLLKSSQLDAVYRLNVALAELAQATGTLVGQGGSLYPGDKP